METLKTLNFSSGNGSDTEYVSGGTDIPRSCRTYTISSLYRDYSSVIIGNPEWCKSCEKMKSFSKFKIFKQIKQDLNLNLGGLVQVPMEIGVKQK